MLVVLVGEVARDDGSPVDVVSGSECGQSMCLRSGKGKLMEGNYNEARLEVWATDDTVAGVFARDNGGRRREQGRQQGWSGPGAGSS